MEDIMRTTLTGTLGDASAVMTITPSGDLALSMVLAVNGAVTDTDTVEFDSASDRDDAYSKVVFSMLTAGYERRLPAPS
jgi:hypothetical protein